MKAVEREYLVAIQAHDVLISTIQRDRWVLKNKGLEQADFDNLRENLDSTYLIRLFAEFEAGLRQYWKQWLKRKTVPKAVQLIESIGLRQNVHHIQVMKANEVRKYRNKLVHEEDSEAQVVGISKARRSLCIFFSKLDEEW